MGKLCKTSSAQMGSRKEKSSFVSPGFAILDRMINAQDNTTC